MTRHATSLLRPPATLIDARERQRRNGYSGAVVWLTGLSGSGKSSVAWGTERLLFDRGVQAVVLDGDVVRAGLSRDLGFSQGDRSEQVRRMTEVSLLVAEAGLVAIVAVISPYQVDRTRARIRTKSAGVPFVEVFVNAPAALCQQRDPKGLYARANAGAIQSFTGVSATYEVPDAPELTLDTEHQVLADSVDMLGGFIMDLIRD